MDHHSPDKDYLSFFDHYDATDIVFGEGAFTQLGGEMLLNGIQTVLTVFGGESKMKNGTYRAFTSLMLSFDIESPVFAGVPAEPDVECVRAIVKQLEECKPDAVVAIGGGSVMDAAKAAYLSWQSGLDVAELFGVNVASAKFPDKTFKRVICIPTTSGTGSEVTPYSNIIDKTKDLKYIINDTAIVPDLALVDPYFTRTMDNELTAATALDAMTHAIESLLNFRAKDPDPMAEKWAVACVKLIRFALPRVLQDPESQLDREMLSAAAVLGGMCIKTRPTALPHLCSYSMWGRIPHGYAVSLLLSSFWKFYLDGPQEVAAQTMKLAGIFPSDSEQKTPADVVAACEAFIASVSPYAKISAVPGFDQALVAKIAADALKNQSKLLSAPRSVPADEAEKIISDILSKAI